MADSNAPIVIAGYYGHRNWGDEASLAALLQVIPQERACAISGDPSWTEETYRIRAIARLPLRPLKQLINRSSALLLGGGSLLQDATSTRSLIYYLTLIRWGMRAHRKVALVAQGIGPLKRAPSRWITRWILRRVPLITVRDEASARLLKQIGLRQPIEVYADITWALSAQPSPTQPGSQIGLAPRAWKNLPVQETFTRLSVTLQRQELTPVLIPMQPTQDEPLCHAIAGAVETQTGTRPEVITGVQHPSEMMGLFHRFQTVVAVRLHAAIFAAKAGVPVITIPYDPKVEALSRDLGIIQAPLNELENRWDLFRTQQNDSLERLRQGTSEMQNSAEACLERVRSWLL